MIVEVGAKAAPTSTIFIYILGSKSLGSSLTSQIAEKVIRQHVAQNVANCDARLKNTAPFIFYLYLIHEILYKNIFFKFI